MKHLKVLISTIALIALGGYADKLSPKASMSPNAPIGAIEYFESRDGKQWIALFPDRLEALFPSFLGERDKPVRVSYKDIRGIDKTGHKLRIFCTTGEIAFDMSLGGSTDLRRFKEQLEQLMRQAKD